MMRTAAGCDLRRAMRSVVVKVNGNNLAGWTDGPSRAPCERYGIQVFRNHGIPAVAVVGRRIDTASTNRYKRFRSPNRNCRAVSSRLFRCELPCFAAIMRDRGHAFILGWLFIIATHRHAIFGRPESQRENALRGRAMEDRRLCDCPSLSAVSGMKYSGGRAARAKPHVILADSWTA